MRGKVFPRPFRGPSSRDHPRLCGEKKTPPTAIRHSLGSPPPMRGKASVRLHTILSGGITPAYAGKSLVADQHPFGYRGSPPPMRGKGRSLFRRIRQFGITPAYAGKSLVPCRSGKPSPDHPRLCGEKTEACINQKIRMGSPPPMRGKAQAAG